ncbi:MAG: hypothetical protein HY457_01795 [Parcubacteria group bacterium]|nr:hypothetical protein [Parcubacteria group bacterium]
MFSLLTLAFPAIALLHVMGFLPAFDAADSYAVLGVYLLLFILMVNGLDGLRALTKKDKAGETLSPAKNTEEKR